jgi:hypothetical protein
MWFLRGSRTRPVFGKPFLQLSGSRNDMSTEAASHPEDVSLCHQIMDEQQATITGLQRRTERLQHYVEQLLRSKYGPRSERVDPNQLPLFDDDGAQTPDESPTAVDANRCQTISPAKPSNTTSPTTRNAAPGAAKSGSGLAARKVSSWSSCPRC